MKNQQTIDDIYEIILLLGENADKLPQNVVGFFEANSTKPLKKRINLSKGLQNQNFSTETQAFIKYIAKYFESNVNLE